MKTLAQILEESAQVRAEKQESENTAERVGGVLCDLTDFLQNKTALTGLDVRTDMNGVSIEVRAQTGDGQEASTVLKFPEASETQSGIITTALIHTLRAGIDGNSTSIQHLNNELQECLQKITALDSKTKYNGDNITKLFSSSNTHDQKIAAAEKALSAAQASIEENADNIAEMGFLLNIASEKAETATRILTYDGEVRNPTIQMQGISTYDSILFDTVRCMFLVVKAGKYYNAFPDSDYYNEVKDNAWKARTAPLYLRTDTQLVYTFDGSALKPFILSSEQKNKLASYPAQFVLDLGYMPTEKEGDAKAASSEVAGNRDISFVRFNTTGVNAKKVTLILQYPNGVNETAQIKFVDKAQWRRNVTGATGVAGASTTATTWERTAPHYLGYDKATRKIQFKDYTQTVSRDVELPLATPSTAGLMATSDKAVVGKSTGTFDISANSLDNLTTEGTYYINGERTRDNDGLPIDNQGGGHTVNGVIRVLNSSISGNGASTDKVVTQILTMSNRVGGDGHIWIRTGQGAAESALAWGTWEKLQGLFEKAMVSTIADFNTYTTNGMYSGIFVGPGTFLGGIGIEQFSQFLIISNNGYAVARTGLVPQISQLLYLLPHGADGSRVRNARLYLRTGIYNSASKSYQFSNFETLATSYDINALADRISALETALNSAT